MYRFINSDKIIKTDSVNTNIIRGCGMNEKFFDLKKEKQDRVICAALKLFGSSGYKHASCDDIVREAGISKGLLFHYFISKLGLYGFLYDYSVRFLSLEIDSNVDKNETDFFEIRKQLLKAKIDVMSQYPYMIRFLNVADDEKEPEAILQIKEKKEALKSIYERILDNADITVFLDGTDYERISRMLDYTLNGLLKDYLAKEYFDPEQYKNEAFRFIDIVSGLCRRE